MDTRTDIVCPLPGLYTKIPVHLSLMQAHTSVSHAGPQPQHGLAPEVAGGAAVVGGGENGEASAAVVLGVTAQRGGHLRARRPRR